MERRYRNISGIDGVKTVMTYNEAFPLWVAEVYRNHGYEPDTWYGSEVAEKMHKEALATYKGPPATMLDYVEAIPSEEEFEYLDYAIQQLRKDNINLNALPDKERWAVMDRIIAEYAELDILPTAKAGGFLHQPPLHSNRGCCVLHDVRQALLPVCPTVR